MEESLMKVWLAAMWKIENEPNELGGSLRRFSGNILNIPTDFL